MDAVDADGDNIRKRESRASVYVHRRNACGIPTSYFAVAGFHRVRNSVTALACIPRMASNSPVFWL